MNITINSVSERKLVAVLGVGGKGFYIRKGVGSSAYIDGSGSYGNETKSIETLLSLDRSRTGIYEGDSITITF